MNINELVEQLQIQLALQSNKIASASEVFKDLARDKNPDYGAIQAACDDLQRLNDEVQPVIKFIADNAVFAKEAMGHTKKFLKSVAKGK